MPEIGSDDWLDAFGRAVAELDAGPVAITVLHRIAGGPAWTVTAGDGRVVVARADPDADADADADVTFTWQRADAEAVAGGRLSPLAPFQAGRLTVGGDLRRLGDAADLFARFPPVPAGADA